MSGNSYKPRTFTPSMDFYCPFYVLGKPIGAANIIKRPDEVYILNIESSEERKGYGTIMVNYLLESYGLVKGVATEYSMGFWEKAGAVFGEDGKSFELRKK